MDQHLESMERPLSASLKATYRALLARGLEAGEAANLTAFLHGLPSAGFRWTLPEVEAIVHRRLIYAADQRAAAGTALPTTASPAGTSATRPRRAMGSHPRPARTSSTHAINPPTA